MSNKNKNKNDNQLPKVRNEGFPKGRTSGYEDAVPGINTPGIELPAFNPPVPNRAWTEMKNSIEHLSEEEKRNLYFGR